AAIFRSSGLNPGALWLDDAWQAVLSSASLEEQLRFSSSAPIGYSYALGLFAGLIPDLELGFQLPAFVFGLLQVPLFAVLVFRVTRSEACAVWGAALSAVCFHFILYSSRVKQYTLDAFIVTLALLCFHRLWQTRGRRRGIVLTSLAGCLVLLFSFSSSIIIAIFLNVLLLRELHKSGWNWRILPRPALAVLAYNLAAISYYLVFLRHQENVALSLFWQDYFVPWEGGLAQVVPFLGNRLALTISSFWHDQVVLGYKGTVVLPGELALVLVSAFLLVMGLSRFRQLRGLDGYWTGAVASLYLSLVALAALHVFPLGGRRTDSFTIPLTLLALIVAVHSLCSFKSGPRLAKLSMAGALAYTVVCGFPGLLGGNPAYPVEDQAGEMIRLAEEDFASDDIMLVYPHGAFAFALYSTMSARLEVSETLSTSFTLRVEDERVHVLPALEGYERNPASLGPVLDDILADARGRVVLVGTHVKLAPLELMNDRIEGSGRTRIFGKYENNCVVMKYSAPVDPKKN
ncbi:MAG: hypothetical protein ACYTG5_09870, partial [Planctomycetota bacterium]